MTYKELIQILCRIEGKKSQVKIGDVKEIVKILKNLIKVNPLGVLKHLVPKVPKTSSKKK
jgi:hypothetical protein